MSISRGYDVWYFEQGGGTQRREGRRERAVQTASVGSSVGSSVGARVKCLPWRMHNIHREKGSTSEEIDTYLGALTRAALAIAS